MGSDLRFDYSVFGDSVNLASRLEGQSKEYGFPIIVGSNTALAAKDRFAILELDFIMVKGKTEPEVIYAIAGREDTAQSGHFQRLRNLTIEMLACYRSRDWDGALATIERGRRTDDAHSLELLYNLYETRIRGYPEGSAAGRLERRLRAADEVGAVGWAKAPLRRAHHHCAGRTDAVMRGHATGRMRVRMLRPPCEFAESRPGRLVRSRLYGAA